MTYLEHIENEALQLTALSARYRKAMKAKSYDPDIFTPVGWANAVTFRCGVFYVYEFCGRVRVTAGGIEVGMCKSFGAAFAMVKRGIGK